MRRGILVAIALVVPALVHWIVHGLPILDNTELLFYDWHMRALPNIPADNRLVFVAMDDESLNHLPLARPSYPLPRTMHAKVVRELSAAGAKRIAFDVMFTGSNPDDDPAFAAALDAAKPVLCGAEPTSRQVNGEELISLTPPGPLLAPYLTACAVNAPRVGGRVRWVQPVVVDADTNERYTHLSAALAAALGANPVDAPTGRDDETLIRFVGPAGTFRPVPYHEVFNGTWRQARGPDFFRDKVVLVGTVNPLLDRALTPLGDMPGTEVLLNAAQTFATANWIRHRFQGVSYVFTSILGLLLALGISAFGVRWGFLILAVEIGLWGFTAHRVFTGYQMWIDTFEPSFALLATLLVTNAYEAGRVRRVFHRFMPSWVAERMLESNPQESAATREVEATVVFCDVRQSTNLAERLPSATIEELLRRYFTAGEESAVRLGTELDKFVGDEIMLYFENRRGFEDHALRAVRWAFDIQKACTEITDSGLAGDIGFRVGVGLATGIVRVGTVGAKTRIQHTVIGDAVNTASRVQALTKDFNEPILISETTWAQVSRSVACVDIGEVPIRGKEKPMKLFKPVQML